MIRPRFSWTSGFEFRWIPVQVQQQSTKEPRSVEQKQGPKKKAVSLQLQNYSGVFCGLSWSPTANDVSLMLDLGLSQLKRAGHRQSCCVRRRIDPMLLSSKKCLLLKNNSPYLGYPSPKWENCRFLRCWHCFNPDVNNKANLPGPLVGPLVAFHTETAVWTYQTGAPESSKFVLLSNLSFHDTNNSSGCPPLQIQGPQHLLLIEAITNSVYVALGQADALVTERFRFR